MVLAVVLENNVWTYRPGQIINGNVVVTKNIWHKIEGLSIRFLGKLEFGSAASTPAAPPEDSLPNSRQDRSFLTRIARCRPVQEILLDHKMSLLHSWKVLKPGSHEFPFTYRLPDEDDLPDSIKIDGCRVTYEFVVVLRRPRDDYKIYQTPFYVQTRIESSELSTSEIISKYSNEVSLKTEDTIGFCMCCTTGPYGLLFRVPRRIVSVGGDIDFIVEIWNDTKTEMECAKMLLIREFKHKKGIDTRKREVVSELLGPRVSPSQHEVWTTFFRVPTHVPQTNFVRRETYEINYYLKALVHPVNRPNQKISAKCPILVIIQEDHISDDPVILPPSYAVEESPVANGAPPTYEEALQDTTSTAPLVEFNLDVAGSI